MARKKKLINKSNVPQYAIERFARCVFDDIRAFYDSEEGQCEFAAWKAEQAALKVHNKTARATDTAALAVFIDVSFFLVLAVLTLGVLTRRYENIHFRISRNKQIIRTRLPQGSFGSDYIALVPLNRNCPNSQIFNTFLPHYKKRKILINVFIMYIH